MLYIQLQLQYPLHCTYTVYTAPTSNQCFTLRIEAGAACVSLLVLACRLFTFLLITLDSCSRPSWERDTVVYCWVVVTYKWAYHQRTLLARVLKTLILFSINNVNFRSCISAIYPSELELKDTSTSSTEVCYLDTNIKTGDVTTPFGISIYDKRDHFAFRIVNFSHMDSNIPANPAYGVYISQLVRYARICTSKVDFINRLRGLSLRLRQQGFETNRLQNSFNKFVNRHGLIVEKYGAALREMRLAIQA